MNDQSPMIPEADVFVLEYSWDEKDFARLCDYARSVYAARKTLRKNDVKIHSSTHDSIKLAVIFALITVLTAASGALFGDVQAGIAVAKYIAVIALLCIALAVYNAVVIRKTAKRHNGQTSGSMTFSEEGIKDEADKTTHIYAWEKVDMCIVTEKVIVFTFREAALFLFIPTTEESKQTVIGAFRRFGHFDDIYMRSVK